MPAHDPFSFAETLARQAPDALSPTIRLTASVEAQATPDRIVKATATTAEEASNAAAARKRGQADAARQSGSGLGRRDADGSEAIAAGAGAGTTAGYVRPSVTGDPLDLSTDPSVPKPLSAIEILEPESGLRLEDRKLFNLLLALSWDRLTEQRPEQPFSAPTADLRRAMGQGTRNDNRRLRESLRRLMRTLMTFPRLMEDGKTNKAIAPLLAFGSIPQGAGFVEWDFHELIRPHLASPCVWARLHLDVCAAFRSKYALVLYEMLSLRGGRNWPVWDVSVDDLRCYMGVTDKLGDWGQLERRVIAPAVAEVNRLARFRVSYSAATARSSRRVETVRFRVLGRGKTSS